MSYLDPAYQLTKPGNPATGTSLPGDPTGPCYQTPGTNTGISLNHQNDAANRSASSVHGRSQTHSSIVLCLPAQQRTPARNITSQPIHTNMPPNDLASPSQVSGSLPLNPVSKFGTFWTACHRCRMQYKYLDIFLNQELLCRKCKLPFMAIEVPPPTAGILKSLAVPIPDQCPTTSSDSRPVVDASTNSLDEMQIAKKRRCVSKRAIPCRNSAGDRRLPFESRVLTSMSSLDPPYQLTQPGNPATGTNLPGVPTTPCYQTPGTSTEVTLNRQNAAANMSDSCVHGRSQKRSSIILCLPAQQRTPARTITSQPIHTNMPPKDLASPSQTSGTLPQNPASKSGTFWTSCPRCRMQHKFLDIFLNQELLCRKCELPFLGVEVPLPKAGILKSLSVPIPDQCPTASSDLRPVVDACTSGLAKEQTVKRRRSGNKRAIPCRNPVGNERLPLQTSMPRRPKELPREDIRRMLMEKARSEISRYLGMIMVLDI